MTQIMNLTEYVFFLIRFLIRRANVQQLWHEAS